MTLTHFDTIQEAVDFQKENGGHVFSDVHTSGFYPVSVADDSQAQKLTDAGYGKVNDLATEKQINYLALLNYKGRNPISKTEASQFIQSQKEWKNAVGACHYCGQPAFGWGFFDEPACNQCGGK